MTEKEMCLRQKAEEHQASLRGEECEEVVVDCTFEKYVKIFAYVILVIGIIYAVYTFYISYKTYISPTVETYSNMEGLSYADRGKGIGSVIGACLEMMITQMIAFVAIWILLTLTANISIRSKVNEARIDNM